MVKSVLCTASAGAGKTYRLTQEVFQRIQEPNRFVVAVTFTRAAAAEMERRLLDEIVAGPKAPEEPAAKLSLLMRASKVHFSTLDSLFYLFLSTESYVPQIATEHEITLIHRRADAKFFHQPGVQEKLSILVILARILNIEPDQLTETLYDESDLLLSWPYHESEQKTLWEQQEILKNRFLEYQNQVDKIALTCHTGETSKSLHRLVITQLLKPLKEQPANCLVNCEDLDKVGTGRGGIPDAQRNTEAYAKLKELYPPMRGLVAEYIINTQKLRAALLRQFAEAYVAAVEEEKHNSRRIFFEDVAKRLAHLDGGEEARDRPTLLARLYELGFHKVSDLFLDEFQDTSQIQLKLLRPLMEELLSSVNHEALGNRSIFLVGDWKQSIYQWRDADPEALLDWCRTYRQSGQLSEDRLCYNWRSTPLLIGFFNNLVSTLFKNTEREQEFQFPPPEKQREAYRGYSKVEVVPVVCDRSDEALYQEVLKEITKLREQGVPYGEITILCRTHSHIRKVTEILAQNSIFTASIKGREVLSTLEGMALYLAIARVFLGIPPTGQQRSDQPRKGRQSEALVPGKQVESSTFAEESVQGGQDYIENALTFLGYGETLLPLARKSAEEIHRLGGPHRFSSLARILSTFEPHLPRVVVEAVWTFGEGYFQNDEAKDIHSFLVEWRQNSSLITVPEPEHSERVKISTIHGVKGLEFPHVILLWKEEHVSFSVLPHPEHRFPLSLTNKNTREFLKTEPVHGAEEFVRPYIEASETRKKETANLLYVAVTRAKQSLTILVRANKEEGNERYSDLLVGACQIAIEEKIEPRAQKTEHGWTCQYGPEPSAPVSAESPATPGVEPDSGFLPSLRITTQPSAPALRELDPAYLSESMEAAITRGSRIHRALSSVTSEGKFQATEVVDEHEREVIQKFLSHPEVQKVLFRPGTVYTEQHLSDRNEFGIVDRLIVSKDRITLIDFKTGYRTPNLLAQYRTQMERYRAMLTTLFPNYSLEAYLLFVDDVKNPIEAV